MSVGGGGGGQWYNCSTKHKTEKAALKALHAFGSGHHPHYHLFLIALRYPSSLEHKQTQTSIRVVMAMVVVNPDIELMKKRKKKKRRRAKLGTRVVAFGVHDLCTEQRETARCSMN